MKMKKLVAVLFCMILCVGCLAACGGSDSAESGDSYVIHLASDEPNDSASSKASELFAEKIAEATDGRITVEYLPDGQMGGDSELIQSLQMGNLEMAMYNSSMYTTYDEDFNILELPYVFTDLEKKYALLDGELGDALKERAIAANGTEIVAFLEGTPRCISNNTRPIKTVDDMAGVKTRVIEADVNLAVYEAWGGTPVPMAFTEVYTALQQGTLDGVDTSPCYVATGKLNEVNKYFTLTDHQSVTLVVAINKEFIDSLPEDLQQILRDVAYETLSVEQRQIIADANAGYIEDMKAAGMEEYVQTEAEKQTFIDASQPVIEKYRDIISPELYEMVGF